MRRWLIGVLAFLLASVAVPASAEEGSKALFVEWHGSWWAAHAVGRTNDGRTVIHYDGWGNEWDEGVDASRMTHAVEDGKLVVAWGGSWWPASVIASDRPGVFRVHYDGWGAEWDETVDRSRIRHLALGKR